MADFLIDDMSGHLAASKNLDYRSNARQRFRVSVDFLQDNDLTTRTLVEDDEDLGDDFKTMRSDLTDNGFDVAKAAYDKWLRGLDKSKEIHDISTLRKALEKIR